MNSKSPIFTAQSDVALRIHVDRAVRHQLCTIARRATISGIRHGAGGNGEASSICSS